MLEVRLLGQFAVHLDGRPIEIPWRPAQLLLAYLILNVGTAQRREKLAGLLWPDSDEANARNNLRQTLWRLRQAVGEEYFLTDKFSVELNPGADYYLDVDLLLDKDVETSSIDELIQLASTYEGSLLPGFYEDWVVLEQERLQAVFEHKLQLLLNRLVESRRWSDVLAWGERWIALGQTPEPAYRALMLAHGGLGDRSSVVVVYQRCVKALQQDLGVEPSEQTRKLYERLLSGEEPAFEASPTLEGFSGQIPKSRPIKLPLQATPFIGREEELSRLATLLADPSVKLVTLLGPGGMGKTRLAIKAARAQAEKFADGIFFVSLASIDDPGFITSQIADTLNFQFHARDQREHREYDMQIAQLLAYLRDKQLLLVLDNTEQLLTAALPSPPKWEKSVDALIADIIRVAPQVKILATSRERLNLQGETLLPLNGLSLPKRKATEQDILALDNAPSFAAVNLFRQVARRVQPGFELTPDNLIDVIDICHLVEGMPLGVELAAAWVELLAPAEIAAEIRTSLDFLETTLRDIPDRQRSIRSVFETSWQRLSQTEQEVFQQLSIFRGGFTREAAQTVTGASLRTLMALVNKSLLRPDFKGRYQLHELLRQFAEEKLQANPPEQAQTQERHSAYYAAFIQRREATLKGVQHQAVLTEISEEIENVRASWNWAVEQYQVETIDQALTSLYDFYWMRSWFQEGEEVFRRAAESLAGVMERGRTGEIVLGKLLARQGAFCYALGRYEPARELLQKSLALVRRLVARVEIAFALRFLGRVMDTQDKLTEAKRLFQESLAISRELGDLPGAVETLHQLSETVMNVPGEYHSEAKRYSQESLTLSRAVGDQRLIGYSLDKLAFMTFCLGEYLEAEQYYQECLAIFKEIDDRYGLALVLGGPAWVALGLGGDRLALAKPLAEKSLAIWREVGDRLRMVVRLNQLGQLALALKEYAEAQQYYGEALAIGREIGHEAGLWALSGLGEAACGLGDLPAARQYLLETLKTAITKEEGHDITFLYTLLRWAILLAKEIASLDKGSPISEAKKVQAVELLALVLHHPANWQVFKDNAARLLVELEADLPPEVVTAAQERGKSRPLAEAVTEIVGEA